MLMQADLGRRLWQLLRFTLLLVVLLPPQPNDHQVFKKPIKATFLSSSTANPL
jgi:hypothetical protein